MDKDLIVVEYIKIYFDSHPEKVPEDADQAFELFKKMHKKYKTKLTKKIIFIKGQFVI